MGPRLGIVAFLSWKKRAEISDFDNKISPRSPLSRLFILKEVKSFLIRPLVNHYESKFFMYFHLKELTRFMEIARRSLSPASQSRCFLIWERRFIANCISIITQWELPNSKQRDRFA